MRAKLLRLPKKAKTLTKKIIRINPWKLGNSLASVIETNWQDIKICNDLNSLADCLKVWAIENHLAPFHVATTIQIDIIENNI